MIRRRSKSRRRCTIVRRRQLPLRLPCNCDFAAKEMLATAKEKREEVRQEVAAAEEKQKKVQQEVAVFDERVAVFERVVETREMLESGELVKKLECEVEKLKARLEEAKHEQEVQRGKYRQLEEVVELRLHRERVNHALRIQQVQQVAESHKQQLLQLQRSQRVLPSIRYLLQ